MNAVGMGAYGAVIGWLGVLIVWPPSIASALRGRPVALAVALWAACPIVAWFYAGHDGAFATALGLFAGVLAASARLFSRMARS